MVSSDPLAPQSGQPSSEPRDPLYLGQSYPNPFNPRVWIPFGVPQTDKPVLLQIHNLLGQPVRTLVDRQLVGGVHRIPWDGRDEEGHEAPAGVYVCRLQAGSQVRAGKLVKLP